MTVGEPCSINCDVHIANESLDDLVPRESGGTALSPACSREQLSNDLLDPYNVAYSSAVPDEAACSPSCPRLAAAPCTAFNDWLVAQWLAEELRLRGTIVVPAQHPEAAADEIRRLGHRDEFVGVFMPGGARIPHGNPIYDPIWRAASERG